MTMLTDHAIVLMVGWETTVHNLAGYNLSINCLCIILF